MNKKIAIIIVLAVLCALIGHYAESISPQQKISPTENSSDQLLLNMLGETRYTLAAFAWLKADFYHHEYEFNAKDWKKNEALMSLIRLVTYLDPHFIQAYDFGGYHLAINLDRPDEGLAFLDEGIRYNPSSFELLWEKGFILAQQKKYREALPFLLKALPLYNQHTNMDNTALKKIWVLSRIAHCYAELKDRDNTRRYCEEWLQISPEASWPRETLDKLKSPEKPGKDK
jgi:tetratricopeptide (TPR) repeat protein